MSRDLHVRASELFLQAADLSPEERSGFLQNACGDDMELRRELESLLLHDDGPTPETSASRGAVVGGVFSMLFGSRLRRRAAVVVSALFLLGLVTTLRWQLNAEIRNIRVEELETVLNSGAVGVDLWIKEREADARFWAKDQTVRESMEELTDLAAEHLSALAPDSPDLAAAQQVLYDSPARARLMAAFAEISRPPHRRSGVSGLDRRGFLIADPGRKSWIGRYVSADYRRYFQAVSEKDVVFVPPAVNSQTLADFEPSRPETLSTFIAAAVRDRDGAYIGVLSFFDRAADDFLRILNTARIGRTGETFAFDAKSRMLSESRFTEQLRDAGLLPDDEMGTSARFHLRNPGGHLTSRYRSSESSSAWPATRLVREAAASRGAKDPAQQRGLITEPYRSYRGVEVIGAWMWFEEYGFGLATEMELSEVYAPFRRMDAIISMLFLALAVSVGAGLFSSFGFVRWRQRFRKLEQRMSQYRVKSRIR